MDSDGVTQLWIVGGEEMNDWGMVRRVGRITRQRRSDGRLGVMAPNIARSPSCSSCPSLKSGSERA